MAEKEGYSLKHVLKVDEIRPSSTTSFASPFAIGKYEYNISH
jgi:hypothetical protein